MDLTDTIVPRSDQLNSDDLFASPRTVTITDVRAGSVEQPVDIHLAEYPGRPFKPSKTVRRILVAAWGKDGDAYVGRRLTLYRDPDVRFGGQDVGGIRVSHMSHIDKPMKLALTVSKGKKAPYVVQPLADPPRLADEHRAANAAAAHEASGGQYGSAPAAPVPNYLADARAAQDIAGWRQVWQRAKDAGHLNDALKAKLTPIGEALKAEPQPPPEPAFDEPPAEFQGEAVERGQ